MNRNNSFLTTDAINNAIPTLYNIPIVGEYIEDRDNFGGHGGKLEITDTKIKYKITTKPYGVIPESAEVYWEDVTEADGNTRSYLVVDGIYLWSGRYEELNTLLEEEKFGQSMEIQVENGNFAVIDGQETFKIDEFIFSALCILGIDKGDNPDDHVEPAFESASISVYELDKDNFKSEFNQMIAELKFSLQLQEGGKKVEEVKQDFKEQVTNATETEVVETETKVEETFEQETVEELDETTEEFAVATTEETQDVVENEKTEVEFSLTHNQIDSQLRQLLSVERYVDRWGDSCRKYWYVDRTDTQVIVENTQENYQLYSFDYTINGDNVTIQFESGVKVKIEYVPFEGEGIVFSSKFERLNVEKEALSSELTELKTYKRNREEEDLVVKFSDKLSVEEIKEVFTQFSTISVEELEEKLLVKYAKKNFSLETQPETVKVVAQQFSKIENEKPHNPYGSFFE
ncbi:hypothetical protein [Ureibacillus chungkukjangi]|uniref:hypothetical protein n=1 Tax=Ureibacillus chungkukjangi TaxID=1202712 RepID=UPI00203BC985|nr:hypothetical protein [Ureibacillus chungkukjangi]